MVVQLRIETEIAATPAEVREVVLDFARYSEWHTSFIHSITYGQAPAQPATLPAGSTLKVKVGGLNFVPVIKTNTPNGISWRGSVLGGAFAGVHIIQFLDSKITPDGTTFVHGEDYDGWMTWLFSEGPFGIGRKNVMRMFEGYSLDVKARAEALKKQKAEFARVERDTKASRVAGKSELTRH